MLDILNFTEKPDMFDKYWSPKIIGDVNGQYMKLAKLKGDFNRLTLIPHM